MLFYLYFLRTKRKKKKKRKSHLQLASVFWTTDLSFPLSSFPWKANAATPHTGLHSHHSLVFEDRLKATPWLQQNWQGEKFQSKPSASRIRSLFLFGSCLVLQSNTGECRGLSQSSGVDVTLTPPADSASWLICCRTNCFRISGNYWNAICKVPYSHCFAIMDPVEKPSILLLRHKLKLPCDAIKVLELWRFGVQHLPWLWGAEFLQFSHLTRHAK